MTEETLRCVAGDHLWTRTRKRGRKPVNCPEHQREATPTPTPMSKSERVERMHSAKRSQADERIWAVVKGSSQFATCNCDLKEGMTRDELQALGTGCTHPYYVCPTLDRFRRLLGY